MMENKLTFVLVLAVVAILPSVSSSQQGNHGNGQGRGRRTWITVPDPWRVHSLDARSPPSRAGYYKDFAVATGSPICSELGRNVVEAGGNTVDAWVVAQLCVCIVHPHSCGIAGGFLATIRHPNGTVESVISREKAPLAANATMFGGDSSKAKIGALAIGVPGEVRGLAEVHTKYGQLGWYDLLTPVYKLCRYGYRVDHPLAYALMVRSSMIVNDPDTWLPFAKKDGNNDWVVKELNDLVQLPKLADTFKAIRDDKDSMYTGVLARELLDDLANIESIITEEDLQTYQPRFEEAVKHEIVREHGTLVFYGPPPPSSAAVLYYILGIMNALDGSACSLDNINDEILTDHRILEAFKFAYAQRANLGDGAFESEGNQPILDALRDASFAEHAASMIDDNNVLNTSVYDLPPDHGTAHVSLYGKDGFAISSTSTINLFFGSRTRGSVTGMVMNNEIDDFSFEEFENSFGFNFSLSNEIEPGKMPMSSMSPTIITYRDLDDKETVVGVTGSSGGSRIISGVALTILRFLWYGLNPTEAMDRPRFHHQWLPNDTVLHEPELDQRIVDGLAAKGQGPIFKTRGQPKEFSVQQNIFLYCAGTKPSRYDQCVEELTWLWANSDWRRGGAPAGGLEVF